MASALVLKPSPHVHIQKLAKLLHTSNAISLAEVGHRLHTWINIHVSMQHDPAPHPSPPRSSVIKGQGHEENVRYVGGWEVHWKDGIGPQEALPIGQWHRLPPMTAARPSSPTPHHPAQALGKD